ncbi:hypothetical protein BH23ACT9_BH23ACT9_20950 [soil metagenome]
MSSHTAAPHMNDTPTNSETARLVAQLALSVAWSHLDGRRPHPVAAAVEALEQQPDADVMAEVTTAVDAAAADLDWTEQVAYALHLLLTTRTGALIAA